MLTELFESDGARIRTLRSGPSGVLLEGFAQTLVRSGRVPGQIDAVRAGPSALSQGVGRGSDSGHSVNMV